MKPNLPINSPRRSFKSKYSEIKEEEIFFIESLYLFKYYNQIKTVFRELEFIIAKDIFIIPKNILIICIYFGVH